MLGCVVSISASSCETFFSPWHSALISLRRIRVDKMENGSAAEEKTASAEAGSRHASPECGSDAPKRQGLADSP